MFCKCLPLITHYRLVGRFVWPPKRKAIGTSRLVAMALIGAGLITAGGLVGQGDTGLERQGEAGLEGQGEAGLEGQGEAELEGQGESMEGSVEAGVPKKVTKEKFKCKYCPKSYVNKGSLVNHEKRDHAEGQKRTTKVKLLAPVRLPEDREVQGMIKSRNKVSLPPLKNIIDNINMVTIKKTNKAKETSYDMEKVDPIERKDGEDELEMNQDIEVEPEKNNKSEHEPGRFKTPYRDKEISIDNKHGSVTSQDSQLRSERRQDRDHDRSERSQKKGDGSQERCDGSMERFGRSQERSQESEGSHGKCERSQGGSQKNQRESQKMKARSHKRGEGVNVKERLHTGEGLLQ